MRTFILQSSLSVAYKNVLNKKKIYKKNVHVLTGYNVHGK